MQPSQSKSIINHIGYCHRCGRTDEIGTMNVEKCVDCIAMGFSID
ncbi:MAG: hypothetical protein ACPG9D_04125 [Candidatus Poseidoniaceae archaeon]